MALFVGKWEEVESSKNYTDYLKEIGVGYFMRKRASKVKPVLIIENCGANWTFSFRSKFKNTDLKIAQDEEFIEKNMHGQKVRSILKMEDKNKLIHEQRCLKTDKIISTIVREVENEKLTLVLTAGKVVCEKIFKKIEKEPFVNNT